MASPFDLKSALLAKHAQHVVLVHFPDRADDHGDRLRVDRGAGGLDRGPRRWPTAAYWNLTAAAATSVATVATGLLAWQWQLEGAPLQGTLLLHALFGGASAGGILLLWWLRFRQRRPAAAHPAWRISRSP